MFDQLEKLDTAIARCIRNKMIAIVDLHDNTCNGDISQIATLSNWWLSPNVIAMINNYKHSLIINIANEAGYVQWTGNAAAALVDFKNTYQSIVSNMRNAGIEVPLMIDAPDCGTDLDDLASIVVGVATYSGSAPLPPVLCASDDCPSPMSEVVEYYCSTFGFPRPQSISLEDARQKGLHTMLSNQRISNKLMKEVLGITLRSPSYREGAATEFVN